METQRDPLFHLTIRTGGGHWPIIMALTKIAFFGDVVLSLLPIGALPVVPPIEIPLPFILVNAHTPKYMYVPPTSPASSFDLPSSSLGTSWSYLGVGLALILLLLSRSSIGIVNCSI